jgi:hypothetical protein
MIYILLLLMAACAIGILYVQRYNLGILYRRVRGEFVMSVRESLQLTSQKLNVAITLFVLPYIIATNGGIVGQIVEKLPEQYRIILAPFVGYAAFAIVTWARLRLQPPKPNA